MLIKLSDECYVSADQIAEIKISKSTLGVTVRLKDGIVHYHEPPYGQPVYTALDRLAKLVNEDLSKERELHEH